MPAYYHNLSEKWKKLSESFQTSTIPDLAPIATYSDSEIAFKVLKSYFM